VYYIKLSAPADNALNSSLVHFTGIRVYGMSLLASCIKKYLVHSVVDCVLEDYSLQKEKVLRCIPVYSMTVTGTKTVLGSLQVSSPMCSLGGGLGSKL